MNVKQAYNAWSSQYDTNENKTRDLEAHALRSSLADIDFSTCLEIGCGTGKNTVWLITKAKRLLAIDLSEAMLAKARKKIVSDKVIFLQADILQDWNFIDKQYELISFSLVLEHIENLDFIFKQASKALIAGGHVYIGELHPFKQYSGSKARFETTEGLQIVSCFNHHITDFVQAAKTYGLELIHINEYFDDNDRSNIPRILSLVLRKQ